MSHVGDMYNGTLKTTVDCSYLRCVFVSAERGEHHGAVEGAGVALRRSPFAVRRGARGAVSIHRPAVVLRAALYKPLGRHRGTLMKP